jgi:REP element-mobilizing transposase RayT
MQRSYFELYIHLVWIVQNRKPLLSLDIEKSVADIIKMKAKKYKANVIALGNTFDYIYVLVSIHPDTVISAMIKEMKAGIHFEYNKGGEVKVETALEKPFFTKDQMVSSTDVARRFSEVKLKAKKAPLGIFDRGGLSVVLMDYDQYEAMFLKIRELEEKLLETTVLERSQRLKEDPSSAIPWRSIVRKPEE